jgi:hypothetical protein
MQASKLVPGISPQRGFTPAIASEPENFVDCDQNFGLAIG